MTPKKTATLNLRIDPSLKEALRIAADQEHRSIANMVETLIRQHCEKRNIPLLEQHLLFGANKDEGKKSQATDSERCSETSVYKIDRLEISC